MDYAEAPSTPATANRSSDSKEKETVKVVVRCRPFSSKEVNESRKSIITIDTQAGVVGIRCPENDQIKPFTFDSVYDETTSQRQFYDESGYPLVESIFEGYNGTIFAYGQTGCGKTHTMQGRDSPPELRGVIPLSFDHIFENIHADPSKEYMVRASYLEIYNEEIRDLLADDQKKKLELKEAADGTVYVRDLIDVVVNDVDSINRVMTKGFKNRTVGATLMNEGSSRSHSIFTVVVEMGEKVGGQEHFKAGKLNLVDLAGSERQSKTGATGSRLKEGCKINLSLSALGNVISALVDGKGKHIPYRDSKLTRLLQDSLGGNTKTLMVAAISPADYNYDETLSTLRYANRAKNIKNKPIVNEDPKDAKLREYKDEIERLKKMLDVQSRGSGDVDAGPLSGTSTPTRPLSSSVGTLDGDDGGRAAAQEREREEIAKYQREATEMMAQAKRMMEEAHSLREQQQLQQAEQQSHPQSQQQPPGQDPANDDRLRAEGEVVVSAEPSPPQIQIQQQPHLSMDVVRVLSSSSLNSPKPGSAGRPASLPPLGLSSVPSPRADQARTPVITAAPPADTVPPTFTVPPSPRPPILIALVEDPAIAKSLEEAAKVDAQAKAMMVKAEQLMQEAERRAKEPPTVQIVKEVVVKEVIPETHLKEKAQLHELNATILTQNDRIGQELLRTQQAMESFVREKHELQTKLKKIEGQILGGTSVRHLTPGDGQSATAVDSEIALLKQQVEYRRAQIKLREKAKKEAHYEAAKKTLTLEKHLIEEELKNAQETAQATLVSAKKKESKFRSKLDAARQEVLDLTNEFERERENLLDTIREQTKESKLLEQLVELFLPQNELVKVWERAVWLDDKDEWQLPKIKPRSDFQKLKLPTLNGGGGASPTVASGGAEVASDDDGASTIGPSSVRSVGSASATKRPKPTHARPPTSSSGATTNGNGSYSARIDEIGGPPLNQLSPPTHRMLSPATRLPSAIRPPQQPSAKHDPHEPHQQDPDASSSSKASRDKDKPRRKSKTKVSEGTQSFHMPQQPAVYLADKFFPPSDDRDQLAPLNPDAYQPRDRLQSRQGSRQGSRAAHDRATHSNTSSRSSLGEFDAPVVSATTREISINSFPVEKPPIDRRSSGSRGATSGTRKHRHRPSAVDSGNGDQDTPLDPDQGEASPDASLLKKNKRDKYAKKKRDRTDKHGSGDVDPSDDPSDSVQSRDLGDGFILPRTTRSLPFSNSGENQDR